MERKVRFEYHCDPSIDFEVRNLDKSKACQFTFQIYTAKACHVLPGSPYSTTLISSPSSSTRSGSYLGGFLYRVYEFYKAIFLMIVKALYYILVCFIIYCIFRVLQIVWVERTQSSGRTSFTKSIPLKDRALYYYHRVKASILGQ